MRYSVTITGGLSLGQALDRARFSDGPVFVMLHDGEEDWMLRNASWILENWARLHDATYPIYMPRLDTTPPMGLGVCDDCAGTGLYKDDMGCWRVCPCRGVQR